MGEDILIALGSIIQKVKRNGLSFYTNPDMLSYCEHSLPCSLSKGVREVSNCV